MGCGSSQPVRVAPTLHIQDHPQPSEKRKTKEDELNELWSGYVSIHGGK
jgi:hypothetical protein